jgi:transposase InsO family protein
VRNSSQQATQQVGSGDDAPLRAPDQDQIVVDNIVVRPLLHNPQASNDVAEPRLHISYDARVLPFFEEHDVKLLRVLTDRGSEYCGNPERHEYELYLAVEDIDHSRTKTKSPQTNGICERFHKTVLNEFYRVAFRKKVYRSIDELQVSPSHPCVRRLRDSQAARTAATKRREALTSDPCHPMRDPAEPTVGGLWARKSATGKRRC